MAMAGGHTGDYFLQDFTSRNMSVSARAFIERQKKIWSLNRKLRSPQMSFEGLFIRKKWMRKAARSLLLK